MRRDWGFFSRYRAPFWPQAARESSNRPTMKRRAGRLWVNRMGAGRGLVSRGVRMGSRGYQSPGPRVVLPAFARRRACEKTCCARDLPPHPRRARQGRGARRDPRGLRPSSRSGAGGDRDRYEDGGGVHAPSPGNDPASMIAGWGARRPARGFGRAQGPTEHPRVGPARLATCDQFRQKSFGTGARNSMPQPSGPCAPGFATPLFIRTNPSSMTQDTDRSTPWRTIARGASASCRAG